MLIKTLITEAAYGVSVTRVRKQTETHDPTMTDTGGLGLGAVWANSSIPIPEYWARVRVARVWRVIGRSKAVLAVM